MNAVPKPGTEKPRLQDRRDSSSGQAILRWDILRQEAAQIMDDIDLLGNDASLASKMLWGRLNTLFAFFEIDD